MRASELIGLPAYDEHGGEIGVVTDIRVVQIPAGDDSHVRIQLSGLLVSPRRTGSLLGYDTEAQRGPALLRWLMLRVHRGARVVP